MVFFPSDDSDLQTIQQTVNAVVSAYIVDVLEQHRVKPIVDVAVARFEAFLSRRLQLEETRTALEDRKAIERAKGLVVKQQNCSEDEAFHSMRKLAIALPPGGGKPEP
ncbi:MAG: ANTAR domain-containing response regulator [Pseudomonadota bacterium]